MYCMPSSGVGIYIESPITGAVTVEFWLDLTQAGMGIKAGQLFARKPLKPL